MVTFWGLPLLTAAGRVMTPRGASEQLVEAAVGRAGDGPVRVADVGTGSGAIAIALAHSLPRADVFATDTSTAAVALARTNVRRLGLSDRVSVLHGDLLDPVPGMLDVVVANLPYLPLAEAGRDDELASEPAEAIFAPADGLGPYRRLIAASRERLSDHGALVIQLRRRVLAARRDGLDALEAVLAAPASGVALDVAGAAA